MRALLRPLGPILVMLALAACDTAAERAEAHYERALALLAAGDWDRAAVELRNVFRLAPEHVAARLSFAALLRDRGETREAFGQLLRAVEDDPDGVPARRALVELALEVRDFATAAEHARAALRRAPDDPGIRALKAAVDFRDPATRDAAVAAARAVVAEDPAVVPAQMVLVAERIAAGAPREALALIDAALAHAPRDEDLHLARLAALESLGDAAGAGAELERMAALFPENPGVRAALVQWHLRRGDADGAEAVLRAAAARDPGPQGELTVVEFLLEVRGPAAAGAELDRLIAAAADPRPFRRARAGLDFATGDRAAGIAGLRGLLTGAAPSDATRELEVSLAEMLAATGATAESAAILDSVLAADPAQVAGLKLRAKLAIDADRPEAAIQDMRTALAEAPNEPEIMTITALAHARAGSRELAGEQFARAVEAAAQAPAESLRYARFLMQDGRAGPAEGVVADALRRAPDDPALLEMLGRIHLARGDWPRAVQVAKRLRDHGDPAARALADGLEAASLKAEGRTAETVALLEAMAGTDGSAMAELVRTRVEAGDLDGARGYLDGVLAKDPESLPARLLAAGLAALRGDADAEAGYRAVIADAPGLVPAHRAYAAYLAAEGRTADALAALDAGLAAAPGDGALMFAKAALAETTGDIDGALALYQELYARDSGSAVLANNLASLMTAARGDPASLERAWEVARRLRGSEVPEFQDTYGWILHLRGDPAQALEYLEPAAEALPGNALVLYHRGEAELALGRREDARRSFEAALAADSSPLPPAAVAAARARLAAPEAGDGG